ncbi:MAG: hemerythrin domain-containing protein [Acidobacteria bacterium]|nr:hemerythrin domain-containing protein [Acidobacteriota bacterium]
MTTRAVPAQFLLESNKALRESLETWQRMLERVRGGSYSECQQAISFLRGLYHSLETESRQRFRQEEKAVYRPAQRQLPALRALVAEMRHEHDAIRQALKSFQRQLSRFNSTGDSRPLVEAGDELARALEAHMEREEHELLPVILKKLPTRTGAPTAPVDPRKSLSQAG